MYLEIMRSLFLGEEAEGRAQRAESKRQSELAVYELYEKYFC